jgi:hypothetical protein
MFGAWGALLVTYRVFGHWRSREEGEEYKENEPSCSTFEQVGDEKRNQVLIMGGIPMNLLKLFIVPEPIDRSSL